MISGRRNVSLICLGMAVVIVAAYWPLRLNGFVNLDDALYITGNCNLQKGLTAETLVWAFRFNNISYWHPLTWISLLIDYEFFGLDPVGYHMLNLLFHYCNAVLLFLVLYRMTGFLRRSLFVAALFAVNPMNVEAVAWAVERKTVLSTFFWLLSIGAYIYHVTKPSVTRYLVLSATFALGLMAKTSVVTLPCILLLLDYWPLGRFAPPASGATPFRHAARLVTEKVPLFLLSLLSAAISIASVRGGGGVAEAVGTPLSEKIANALVSYAAYPVKMLWPTALSVFYPLRHEYPLWQLIGAALFLVTATAYSIAKRKKHPWFAVGWFWFLLSMLPAVGLVRGGLWPEMADRFAYIPLIGLYLLLAWGGSELIGRHRWGATVLAVSATAIIIFYGFLTYTQTGYWRNSVALFEHARKVSGETAEFYRGIGGDHFESGDYGKALALFARVREIEPDSTDVDLAEALIAQQNNDLARAAEFAEKALLKNEDDLSALFLMGEIAESRGEGRKAIRYYNQLLHSLQQDVARYRCRAEEHLNRLAATQVPELRALRRAVETNPSSIPARLELALQLDDLGFYEEALQHYLHLEKSGFKNGNHFFSIGRIYSKLQQGKEAAAYFEKTLQVDPGNIAALNETGLFHLDKKRYRQAISSFEKASALNAQYPFASYNLALTYLKMGDKSTALRYFKLVEERFPDFRVRVMPYIQEIENVSR